MGDFGYNRDGKRGKRQIVIGLLCDHEGEPISIEIFKGNTIDTQTFGRQVKKVAERFGGGEVTFVGDRGMIKGPQVADMVDVGGDEFHYITAITKPQIRKLLKDDVIQLGLFDQRLAEVTTDDGERYIMRRNPIRAEEMRSHREEKRKALVELVEKKNAYLAGHPRASVDVALRDVREYCDSRNLSDYVSIRCRDRVLEIDLDSEELSRIENLDGCYVLKTDLPADRIDKETVHDRYKDLTKVEQAFRECKTTHLELRPIYLRLADRTRAYGLVVMLAYIIRRELARCWADLDMTVEEGIDLLRELTAETVLVNGEEVCTIIPEPREDIRRLIELSGVPMPEMIPCRGERVATRKKLPKRKLRR